MDRFTWKAPDDTYQIDDCMAVHTVTCFDEDFKNAFTIYEGAAIDKLGHYEDLEEQGRLLVLPCKVGDTIYQTKYKCVCTLGHTFLHNTCHSPIECTKCRAVKVERWIIETTFSIDMLDRIGKDLFLTREEAEVALKNI